MRSQRLDPWLRAALCAAAAVGLYLGWAAFWFLCDDAYIAFRYVSNSLRGWGYTWNPPPFRPVEGYTSFLWVVLLDGVWRGFDVEPPAAANWLALLFSYGSLALLASMALRLPLSPGLARHRTLVLGLVLLGTVTNRTFLAWTSSGLETALFGCLLLAWVHLAFFSAGGAGARTALALVAGLLALARPDGLLFAAATAAMLAVHAFAGPRLAPRALAPALPLLLPVAHVLWRRATYGYWLPNTYYAKHIGAWPEAGVRYLAAFLLEYAYWIWLALAAVAVWRGVRAGQRTLVARLRAGDPRTAAALVAGTALAFHVFYYTFLVGGDHFEFRVYQPWVPLLLVSCVWIAERAGVRPRGALAALVAMIALGWPLPWLHWWHTRELATRPQTFKLRFEVAPLVPPPLRWYAAAWDGLEGWLIDHFVGLRHQEHKVFGAYQKARFPTRKVGSRIPLAGHPVFQYHTVGVPGWVLPNVAILDWFGLNDAVIAHSSPARTRPDERQMAHDRIPPEGYAACFRPNVYLDKEAEELRMEPRAAPLTAREIRRCEEYFLDLVSRRRRSSRSRGVRARADAGSQRRRAGSPPRARAGRARARGRRPGAPRAPRPRAGPRPSGRR
jgi:arabinofuranosyltransferase